MEDEKLLVVARLINGHLIFQTRMTKTQATRLRIEWMNNRQPAVRVMTEGGEIVLRRWLMNRCTLEILNPEVQP